MKRKIKLFGTIATISMTLALMVFGIMAATTVNVSISSNVSYTARGVAFKLYGKSELLATQNGSTITGDLTDSTADEVATVGVTNSGTDSMTLPSQAFTTARQWVVYTFTVENIGSNVISFITVEATAEDENITVSTDTPVGNLSQGAKETFRCYFNLADVNKSVESDGVTITIQLGEGSAQDPVYPDLEVETVSLGPTSLEGFSSQTTGDVSSESGETTVYTKGDETLTVKKVNQVSDVATAEGLVGEFYNYTNGNESQEFAVMNGAAYAFLTMLRGTVSFETTNDEGPSTLHERILIMLKPNDDFYEVTNVPVNSKVVIPEFLNIDAVGAIGSNASTENAEGLKLASEIVLPSTVEEIAPTAFSGSPYLTAINIPASTTHIGTEAFKDCHSLAMIYNESALNLTLGSADNGGIAENACFISNSSGVGEIIDSNNVKYFSYNGEKVAVGTYLEDKSQLSSITLANDTTMIKDHAFYGCTNLSSVVLPSSLETIGEYAFTDTALSSLTIPSSVTSVGDGAFVGTNLSSVTINSQSVASSMTSMTACGGVLNQQTSISFGSGITPPSYITQNLTQSGGLYTVPTGSSPASNVTVVNAQPRDGSTVHNVSFTYGGAPFAIYYEGYGDGMETVYGVINVLNGSVTSYDVDPHLTGTDGGHGSSVFRVKVVTLGYESPWQETENYWSCLTGDTLVTMADGKKKRLRDLKKGDKILGVDPLTGKLIVTTVTAGLNTDSVRIAKEYDLWKFSDGTELKTVRRHQFYNMTRGEMTHCNTWEIGDKFVKDDGSVITLVSHERIEKEVDHYNLPTAHHTYFAAGILGGDRCTAPMNPDALKFLK